MAVTVDNAVESVRTDTTSPHDWSHAGAASGVKGIIVTAVHGVSSTDHVTAVSYGGQALTRIQRNVDTSTEPGAAELWFLGTGVPQGTQTVSVTCGSTTDDFHFVSITLLGDGDLEVVDQDGISENVANPSVTLQYAGRTCMAFAVLYGGGVAPSSFTPNANCTTVHDHDLGAFYSEVIRQTTAGSADFAIGGTASHDDVAYSALAVSEVQVAIVLAADGATFNYTGQSVSLLQGYKVQAEGATYNYTGQDVTFVRGSALHAFQADAFQPGAFQMISDYVIAANGGIFNYTGQDVSLEQGYKVAAEVGMFNYTGQDASLEQGYKVTADGATFNYTGENASLEQGYKVAADGAVFNYTGQDVTFSYSQVIAALAGTFNYTGQDVSLERGYPLTATGTTFNYIGQDVALEQGYLVAADGAIFDYTGQDANLEQGYKVAADGATFNYTGQDATLIFTPTGAFIVAADGATFNYTGQDVTLLWKHVVTALGATFNYTGQDVNFIYTPLGSVAPRHYFVHIVHRKRSR